MPKSHQRLFQSFVLTAVLLLAVLTSGHSQQSGVSAMVSGTTEPDSIKGISDSLKIQPEKLDSLFYQADSIAYDYKTEQIYLYGNTNLKYGTATLVADSLQIDLKRERAFSMGRTIMQDGDQILIGRQVYYDVNSQTGMMFAGASRLEKGYYYGEEIRRIKEDIYDVDGGRFTTCDDPEPDFWFWSKEMRLFRNDKIIGRPVVFYVNHFPIMYFPYFTFSIKRGRQAGFLIPEPGYNTVDGKFVRNIAYYYPYKEAADATLSLDLMERTGWRLNLDGRYLDRYTYNGNVNTSFQKRISGSTINYDYALQGNHHHELGEKSTFDANIDYVSNKRIWQGSNDIDQDLAQRVTSSMSYRRPVLSSYLNIGSTYTQDLTNNTVSLNLPSGSYSLPSRPVYELFTGNSDRPVGTHWWTNFNYNYYVRLDHTGDVRAKHRTLGDLIWDNTMDSTGTYYLNQHHLGIKHTVGLSYTYKLLGWLNLSQGFSYNEAWMDRDRNDNKWVGGRDYSASTSANFTLYGLRQFNNYYVSAIRHIVRPSVGFNYRPAFPDNDRFYYFGGIGLNYGKRSRTIGLGLDQLWQVKLAPTKDQKERKLNDLLSWNTSTGLDLEKEEKQFSDIRHTLTFHPAQYNSDSFKLSYNTTYNFSQNPYKVHLLDWKPQGQYFSHSVTINGDAQYVDYFPRKKNDSFNAYLPQQDSLRPPDWQEPAANVQNWTVTFTQDLNAQHNILKPLNNNLRTSASVKLTTNWAVDYSNYLNYKTGKLLSQSYFISRNLHCWKLTISYTRRNDYWDYRIVFFNTALPDALKFQTHDNKKY